ncbi:MAG: methane monooxygenase/ammonia monooxygenase subunit C, partial [Pseudomonadota bacterium]|nr:methane monooxygenase/ammonia monooxygenase subunit C [Pseudomonadota bacterium]
EELFVEPLHWMFVFFGWFSLAVFGVTLQLLGRVVELAHGHEELLGLEPYIIIGEGYKSPFDQHSDPQEQPKAGPQPYQPSQASKLPQPHPPQLHDDERD